MGVDPANLRALCEDAARRLGDDFIAVHVVEHLRRGTYGLLEFVARRKCSTTWLSLIHI